MTELRLLLSKMGKSKSGLKKDLMKRVVDLLHNECNPELLSAVRELHKLRQVSKDARRSSKPSPVQIISMPACVSPENLHSPVSISTEPQMIKLPFYQTLDTILPPAPLGMMHTCEYVVFNHAFSFCGINTKLNIFNSFVTSGVYRCNAIRWLMYRFPYVVPKFLMWIVCMYFQCPCLKEPCRTQISCFISVRVNKLRSRTASEFLSLFILHQRLHRQFVVIDVYI